MTSTPSYSRVTAPPAAVRYRVIAGTIDLVGCGALWVGLSLLLTLVIPKNFIAWAAAAVIIVVPRELVLAITGWSPGGRIMGVRLVDATTGGAPTTRLFIHADLLCVTLGAGAIVFMRSAAADPRGQGQHDRMAGTMAVDTRSRSAGESGRQVPGRQDSGRQAPEQRLPKRQTPRRQSIRHQQQAAVPPQHAAPRTSARAHVFPDNAFFLSPDGSTTDIGSTVDTTSAVVLPPSADRAIIDSVPWAAVPTQVDSPTGEDSPLTPSGTVSSPPAAAATTAMPTPASDVVSPPAQYEPVAVSPVAAPASAPRSPSPQEPVIVPSAESPFSSRPTPPTRSRMATRSAAEPIISTESIPISTPDPTPPSSPAVASGPLASVPPADPTPLSSAAMASGPLASVPSADPTPLSSAAMASGPLASVPSADPTPPSSPAMASGPLASVPSADPTPPSSPAMASGPLASVPSADPTPLSSAAMASGPLASVPSADPTPPSSPAMASGPGTDPGPAAHPVVSASSPSAARGRHRHTEDPRANRLVPLTGGAPIKLESTTVVGRDPDNISDYPGAACVSLNDVTRSISKTHAALALAPGGLWITDLHSTNGTRIEEEGHVTVARPGESIPVPTGATIVLGSAAYRVED